LVDPSFANGPILICLNPIVPVLLPALYPIAIHSVVTALLFLPNAIEFCPILAVPLFDCNPIEIAPSDTVPVVLPACDPIDILKLEYAFVDGPNDIELIPIESLNLPIAILSEPILSVPWFAFDPILICLVPTVPVVTPLFTPIDILSLDSDTLFVPIAIALVAVAFVLSPMLIVVKAETDALFPIAIPDPPEFSDVFVPIAIPVALVVLALSPIEIPSACDKYPIDIAPFAVDVIALDCLPIACLIVQ